MAHRTRTSNRRQCRLQEAAAWVLGVLIALILLSIIASLQCLADDPQVERVLDAIRQVESSGGRDTRDGDGGKAIGPYQIHRAYWMDGTRFLGVSWPYSDARDENKARAVVRAYVTRYGKGSAEGMIRSHNGGPGWRKKPATLIYLRRVHAQMEKGR